MQIFVEIIDQDENSRAAIKSMLSEMDVLLSGEYAEFERGLSHLRQNEIDIVVMNLAPDTEKSLENAETLTQRFPGVALFVISEQTSSDLIIRAMRAGAREFFSRPLQKQDLSLAVQAVAKAKKIKAEQEGKKAKIITVFGTKGGVGTTTVATNLAALLSKMGVKDVILLDLNLQFGNAALFINAKPQYSLVDIAKNLDSIDLNIFKNTIPKNPDGIHILTGPQKIEDAEYFEPRHLAKILEMLKSLFQIIIIDTRSSFDEFTLKVFDESDTIFIISNLEFPTIYNTKNILELFRLMEYTDEKVKVVINRYDEKDASIAEDLTRIYPYPISWKVPNHDYPSMANMVNYGTPVAIKLPKAKVSQLLREMAQTQIAKEQLAGGKMDSVIHKFLKLRAN